MQETRDDVNVKDTPMKEIVHGGRSYIMSKYPITQPPILNVVMASIMKGVFYGVVSIVVLFFMKQEVYLYCLLGDIVLLFGLVLMLLFRHNTLNGKVAKVSNFQGSNISTGGFCMGLMWSSIIRLVVFLVQMTMGIYTSSQVSNFFGYSGFPGKVSAIVGAGVFLLGYMCIFGFKDFDVKKYHKETILYYNNLIKASQKIDKPVQPKPYVPTKYQYGEIGTSTAQKVPPKVEYKKVVQSKVVIPDNVVVKRTPDKPPEDELKSKRVKRKKRNID